MFRSIKIIAFINICITKSYLQDYLDVWPSERVESEQTTQRPITAPTRLECRDLDFNLSFDCFVFFRTFARSAIHPFFVDYSHEFVFAGFTLYFWNNQIFFHSDTEDPACSFTHFRASLIPFKCCPFRIFVLRTFSTSFSFEVINLSISSIVLISTSLELNWPATPFRVTPNPDPTSQTCHAKLHTCKTSPRHTVPDNTSPALPNYAPLSYTILHCACVV